MMLSQNTHRTVPGWNLLISFQFKVEMSNNNKHNRASVSLSIQSLMIKMPVYFERIVFYIVRSLFAIAYHFQSFFSIHETILA